MRYACSGTRREDDAEHLGHSDNAQQRRTGTSREGGHNDTWSNTCQDGVGDFMKGCAEWFAGTSPSDVPPLAIVSLHAPAAEYMRVGGSGITVRILPGEL